MDKCNYFEYRDLTEKCFYGVPLTEEHLNNATEELRQYLINGGAGNIADFLQIGIKEVINYPDKLISRRFIWTEGTRKGQELTIREIESIGWFLPGGAFYGKAGTVKKKEERVEVKFTEQEIDLLMLALIRSCVETSNELQDKLYKVLTECHQDSDSCKHKN